MNRGSDVDGWAEVMCHIDMAGPMYYIQWRWVGRGMCYIRDGWADVLYTMETGGPRNELQ